MSHHLAQLFQDDDWYDGLVGGRRYDPYYIDRVDFRRIPIHIHQIDFSKRARITSLKPGIHYAVNACASEEWVRDEIVRALDLSINQQNMVPAGWRRGRLRDPRATSAWFSMGERDALYDLGINPILRRDGEFYLWGNLFVTPYGRKERMVDPPNSQDPMGRGRPHAELYRLVSNTVWNAP